MNPWRGDSTAEEPSFVLFIALGDDGGCPSSSAQRIKLLTKRRAFPGTNICFPSVLQTRVALHISVMQISGTGGKGSHVSCVSLCRPALGRVPVSSLAVHRTLVA